MRAARACRVGAVGAQCRGRPGNRTPGLGQSANGGKTAAFARIARMRPASIHGFTLVELMVALALTAVLMAAGVHGLGAWLTEQQLRDGAVGLRIALPLARTAAIMGGGRAEVCRGPGAGAGGPLPWEEGWIVVADAARDAQPILRERRAADGITIRGNRPVADYVSYTSHGGARRLDGALQMGTFTVCRPGLRARKVVLGSSGRTRVETTAERCP